MKSATFPSLRVEQGLREAAEAVLLEGESLSAFVEQSIRANIERRRSQGEFVARGLLSRDKARRSGVYVPANLVIGRLEKVLARAKKKAPA